MTWAYDVGRSQRVDRFAEGGVIGGRDGRTRQQRLIRSMLATMSFAFKDAVVVLDALLHKNVVRALNADLFASSADLPRVDWPIPDRETEPAAFAQWVADRLTEPAWRLREYEAVGYVSSKILVDNPRSCAVLTGIAEE